MNYDLAKQLINVGFPIIKTSTLSETMRLGGGYFNADTGEGFIYPTLSELITACGDRFEGLFKANGGWHADGSITGLAHPERQRGKTPEEAVAKLWLELNK